MGKQRIGEHLVSRGVLRVADVELALESARARSAPLGSELVALGLCEEGPVVEALAVQLGVPGVELSRSVLATAVLELVPREVAQQDRILPLAREGDRLLLALAEPHNARVVEEIRLVTGLDVMPHVALSGLLEQAIPAAYDAAAQGARLWVGAAAKGAKAPQLSLRTGVPPAKDELDIPIEIDDALDDAGDEVLGSVNARPGPRTVLAVDDEEEILLLVTKTLESRGLRVEQARRGREALLKASELLPDLVLLDANLPEVHGFDVCRKIKGNPRLAHIPVVMMTAVYRGWRYAQDTREAYGADDYIEKPFQLDDLLRRVEHHLRRATGEPSAGREIAERLYEEAVRHVGEGRVQEAVTALQQAADADAFNARVFYMLGRTLQSVGEAYRAMAAFERTVELAPGHFAALKNLAALYQQKGFKRKAAETWERAIPAAPDDATRARIKQSLVALL